jgi:hypothetical protein
MHGRIKATIMSLGNHLERACTEQLVRTCFVRERDPVAARAVVLDVAAQQVVLLGRPRPPLHTRLVAARRPTHAGAAAAAARAWNGIEELGGGAGWGGGGGGGRVFSGTRWAGNKASKRAAACGERRRVL